MPINTSFAGNIPWLITEPPTAALARGAQVGEGIAHQRLAQQQIDLQAMTAQRLADQELSRQIGMKSASSDIEAYRRANPDASDEEVSKVSARALMKYGPQIFSGNSSGYLKMFDEEDKNRILDQAKQRLFQQQTAHEDTLRDKNRIIEELGKNKILSQGQIAAAKDATSNLGIQGKRVVQDATANLDAVRADAIVQGADLSNITATPIKAPNGDVVAFGIPNGKGGIHYESPAKSGQIEFGVTPTGQHYVKTPNGIHLLHDLEQEAKVKLAVEGLKDTNQRIRDIEASTRLKPEEQAKRLAPLLKQKQGLEDSLKTHLPDVAPPAAVPAAAPSAPQTTPTLQQDKATVLEDARAAIRLGKPREKVIQRLRDLGITEEP